MTRRDKPEPEPEPERGTYSDRIRYCVDYSPVSEVIELRAANEALRRAMLGSTRAPLRPAFRAPVLLDAIPGLAAQFSGRVPASHVVLPPRAHDSADVRCHCKAEVVVVEEGGFAMGECGRFFAMLDGVVRVARPIQDPTSAAAEGQPPAPAR